MPSFEDDRGLREGGGEVGEVGELGMIKPGLEGQLERRQPGKPGAPGRIEQLSLGRIGARLGQRIARIPGNGMANAPKAAVAGGDLGLQHARYPVAEPQIGMADDAGAELRPPILAACAHRRRTIDELGLPDRLHFDRALGAIHRAAFDKHGLGDVVAATGVGKQFSNEIGVGPSRSHR